MRRCKIELLIESEIQSITDNRRAVVNAVALTKLIKPQACVNVSPLGKLFLTTQMKAAAP